MTKTLVTFLLDRTGSMESIKEATIESFNSYITELRKGKGIDFTLVQFDSASIDKVCHNVKAKDAPFLNNENYKPRASTPLIDAAYKTIKAVEEALKRHEKEPKVVICIQTDGFENASREHTWNELNALIKEKIGLGWQFNLMGANIDAYQQGNHMGIPTRNTVSYNGESKTASLAAFSSSAQNTRAYAEGRLASTRYSGEQKSSAGDIFDPDRKVGKKKPVTGNKPAKTIVDDITL